MYTKVLLSDLTANMHAIKSNARRQAWYGSNEEDNEAALRVYNFFGRRYRPETRPGRDSEHGRAALRTTHSDTDIPSPLQRARLDGVLGEERGPHRANTFSGSPAYSHGSHGSIDLGLTTPVPEEISDLELERSPTSKKTSGNAEGADSGDKVRKRRRRKFIKQFRRSSSDGTSTNDEASEKKTASKGIPIMQQLKALAFTWGNIFYCFVPVGFALYYTKVNPVAVFVINFLAIFPSSATLGFAVESMMLYFGDTLGALISFSFGNAAQLITSILLLRGRHILVLQATLLGTIMQNLLLMLGASFFVGGLRRIEQYYNVTVAQNISMFLLLAVLSLAVPTASRWLGGASASGVAAQSRGTAVIIIISYLLWLIFQLKTHRAMFSEPMEKRPTKKYMRRYQKNEKGKVLKGLAVMGAGGAAASGGVVNHEDLVRVEDEDEEEAQPSLSLITSMVTIAISTTLLAFNTEFATNSIQGLLTSQKITTSFLGMVIMPLLNNDPLVVQLALKDKMDFSISLCCERCMQTALLIVPLVVLIAWGMGIEDMTLDFDTFSVASLFASVIIVTYVVGDGKSNWLTGALLLKVFIIVALASFYHPDPD